MKELIKYIHEMEQKHPELKSQIRDLYDLCRYEIEDGNDSEHEIELCKESIRQLCDPLYNPLKRE